MNMDAAELGRRERNKARTREALLAAARQLFVEHGFAATTITSIAAAADVSERTFFRYFAAKEDLLVPGIQQLLSDIEDALRRRPTAETPMTAIRRSVAAVLASHADDGGTGVIAVEMTPDVINGLAGRVAVLSIHWEERFADLITERLRAAGSTEDDSALMLRAAVIVNSVLAASRAALRVHREGPTPAGTVAELIQNAFDILQGGLSAAPRKRSNASQTATVRHG